MIEVVLAAFNILLLMLIWECFFKKTLLDTHRDELFDLRCELRSEFAKKNALGTPAYKQTRELLNAQIALTENLSILQYLLWINFIHKNKSVKESIDNQQKDKYFIADKELNAVIRKTRSDSSDICSSYMVTSSLVLTMIVLVLFLVIGVCVLLKNLFVNFNTIFKVAFNKQIFLNIWEKAIHKLHLNQDIVEDASMILAHKA